MKTTFSSVFIFQFCIAFGAEYDIEPGEVVNIPLAVAAGGMVDCRDDIPLAVAAGVMVDCRDDTSATVIECFHNKAICKQTNGHDSFSIHLNNAKDGHFLLGVLPYKNITLRCRLPELVETWKIRIINSPVLIMLGKETSVKCIPNWEDGFIGTFNQSKACNYSFNTQTVTWTSLSHVDEVRDCYVTSYQECVIHGGVTNAVAAGRGVHRQLYFIALSTEINGSENLCIVTTTAYGWNVSSLSIQHQVEKQTIKSFKNELAENKTSFYTYVNCSVHLLDQVFLYKGHTFMKRAIHVPLGGSNKSEAVGGFDVVGFIISFLLDPCAVFVALVCVVVIIYKRKWRIMTNGATPLIPCPDQPLPPMALGGF